MRGKFKSMTMVNWNGFFARTFDLDQLVTTLSGGNGAGKSTTMASPLTAPVPDQALLHPCDLAQVTSDTKQHGFPLLLGRGPVVFTQIFGVFWLICAN